MAPRGVSTWRRPYTSIYNDNYRYGTGLYSDTLTDIEKRYSESISKTKLRSDRPDMTFTTFSGSNLTSSPAPAGDSGGERENYGFSRQLSSSPVVEKREYTRSPNFESRLKATLNSAACELDEDVQTAVRNRIEARRQALARSQSEVESRTEAEEDEDFRARLERRKQALKNLTESSRSDTEEYTVKSKKRATPEEFVRPYSLYEDAAMWSLPKSSDKPSGRDQDKPKSRRKAGGRQTPTNGPSSSQWRDKSRNLQEQVDSLDQSMSSAGNRLRNELTSLKSKYHTELTDLSGSVENTSQQASDLHRLCKRQANQLQELQSAYDAAQRNVQEALEEMSVWQTKCKSLKKEMDRLREEVEQAISKRNKD